MPDRRIAKGIYRTDYGWRFYPRIKGKLRPKRVHDPKHRLTLEGLKEKRDEWKVEARRPAPTVTDQPTLFAQDVTNDYLPSVTSMPSYADREIHMRDWAALFGERKRDTIKPLEIKKQLEAWLAEGKKPGTVNRRRTALMSFFTAMNGKSGYNPVRDVPKYAEDEEPRDQSLWTIYRILALMRPSRTRARLRVFTWTGWPHTQLRQLKPSHVDLQTPQAFLTRRRKGKGRRGVWLPLLPGAVIALKDLAARKGFGPFSHTAMHKSFQLAVGKYNAHRARFGHAPIEVRPYDIRHSFLTWVADHVDDDRVLQELAMHSRPEQSQRYTRRATARRLERGIARLREVTRGNISPEKTSKHQEMQGRREREVAGNQRKRSGRRRRIRAKA